VQARDPEPPPLVLAEVPGPTAGGLEAVLEAHARVASDDELLAWLPELARQLQPATLQASAPARRLVVEALVRLVRHGGFAERFEQVRGLVDALQAAAPHEPETIFARAWLRWVLLSDGRGGLALGGLDRAVVGDLERDLTALVERHPNWRGPGDIDRGWCERQQLAVRRLLATTEAKPGTTTNQPSTEQQQN
jgi:hypothetical protein